MKRAFTRTLLVSLPLCLLSACGGGGGGTSSAAAPAPAPQVNQQIGGIWQTQYTLTSGSTAGDTVNGLAISDQNGRIFFAERDQNNGCTEVGFGQATVSGSAISGTVDFGIASYSSLPGVNTSCTYSDGSTSGNGVITGTIAQQSSMTTTFSGTTSLGTALATETHTWTFNSLYDNASSLSLLAANYTDGSDTLSISTNGAIFEQDPPTGCVINGQMSIINSQYNAYNISMSISSCTGSEAVLNGLTLSGLATLDTSVSPAQLDFGVSTNAGGQYFVLVDTITQQ